MFIHRPVEVNRTSSAMQLLQKVRARSWHLPISLNSFFFLPLELLAYFYGASWPDSWHPTVFVADRLGGFLRSISRIISSCSDCKARCGCFHVDILIFFDVYQLFVAFRWRMMGFVCFCRGQGSHTRMGVVLSSLCNRLVTLCERSSKVDHMKR